MTTALRIQLKKKVARNYENFIEGPALWSDKNVYTNVSVYSILTSRFIKPFSVFRQIARIWVARGLKR